MNPVISSFLYREMTAIKHFFVFNLTFKMVNIHNHGTFVEFYLMCLKNSFLER